MAVQRVALLLLESLESPVGIIEVPEDVMSKLGEIPPRRGDLQLHLGESPVDFRELAPENLGELLVLARGHSVVFYFTLGTRSSVDL